MVECELCGGRANGKAEIEGTIVNVCDTCKGFGKEIRECKAVKKAVKEKLPDEMDLIFVDGFEKIVAGAREKKGLRRSQVAHEIKENVNLINRIENGWMPPIELARKLEKFFGIRLLEMTDKRKISMSKKEHEKLTIGDIAEVK